MTKFAQMPYSLSSLADLLESKSNLVFPEREIAEPVYDTRKVRNPEKALFVALKGRRDGHEYVSEAYQAGIRAFLLERKVNLPSDADQVVVENPLKALQKMAAFHRATFKLPVIGITGSNGKTTVKEWLFHLLGERCEIVRSPRSFNSQLGVPLSVWQINHEHNLGIFEAGISKPGEMTALEEVIKPTIGLLTNLGSAHDEGFVSKEEKLLEKLKLFVGVKELIFHNDNELLRETVLKWQRSNPQVRLMDWGFEEVVTHHFKAESRTGHTLISFEGESISIPFVDKASIENACSCIMVLSAMDLKPNDFKEEFKDLPVLEMRLQQKKGIFDTELINDTYSADLTSLEIALEFLHRQAGNKKKVLVLGDFRETGKSRQELQDEIENILRQFPVDVFIGIGPFFQSFQPKFTGRYLAFASTDEAKSFDWHSLSQSFILVKGSQASGVGNIARMLEQKVHETVLEIDLDAIEKNLHQFRSMLKPETKMMVMVKAYSYGSGSHEIAHLLQYRKADYLSVAYADEGIALRNNGVSLPIMVMNPQQHNLDVLLDFGLEPDVFDFHILARLKELIQEKGLVEAPVHIEFDTGMHRLGFAAGDVPQLINELKSVPAIKVQSVFAHLAAGDDPQHDEFTRKQIEDFREICKLFENEFSPKPLFHILNTAGILRHPEAQMDMVRLGIGLYGANPLETPTISLEPVATLKTNISQLRLIKAGESVGYGRNEILQKDSLIAVLPIGYADGFKRILSKGKGHVWIGGRLVPVTGNVCMDMTMVDVTGIPCKEGDEVEIFGKHRSIESLAKEAETIPYEILSGISPRVKRVYWKE